MKFNAVLDIQLHPGIADPQGSTIERALPTLGFEGISKVRSGKSIHLEIEAADYAAAEAQLSDVCDKFLTNPVIEGATINLVEAG
ncbi:MAG: phosphoribosylformylglycinamidine synthase subunit PurS [Acidimicrobiales bacterium]|nr:phosphoribosylformylglycinamidine synthase subunit PurS [Acidimicrobiales bacterium]RZV48361.1 MAG: phosphoribosylformylglycinamidine synthase subunit PurS [Acidimicrobiales bacterium]